MKKGETKEFDKAYPDANNDYKDVTKKLKVSLKTLQVKKLPDLDDEFAQDVDVNFNTLEDLKNNIRKRLDKDLEQRLKDMKINKILEKIMDSTPVEIPESMLRLELDSRWRNLAQRFNTDTNGLYSIMGERTESIIEGWKPHAIKALHSRLIVETLMEDQKLECSEDEIEKDLERMAEESKTELEDIKKYYENEQMTEYLKEEIKERKIFDILLEKNTIKTGNKEKYIDLISNNG